MVTVSKPIDRVMHVSAGFAAYLTIVQATPGVLRHYLVESPGLVYIRHGKKTIETSSQTLEMTEGDCVFLPESLQCSVTNDGLDGSYQSEVLSFTPEFAAEFCSPDIKTDTCMKASKFKATADFNEAFMRAANALHSDTSDGLRKHMLGEIILRLRELGIDPLVSNGNRLLLDIRRMVGQELAREWRSVDVAKSFSMSEATLRRRLAESGTTLTETIAETRLQTALTLLQSTDLPVTTIAMDCGYQSPSKFAARFRNRYGLAPSQIRIREFERIGA